MLDTWVFAAILAQASGGQTNRVSEARQAIVMPLSGTTMTCTKEADHLVCVIPLAKEAAQEPQLAPAPAAKARVYKPSQPTVALPSPEALTQLKAAQANIELAKSLLPKVTAPEEVVLVQQLLYRAKEQYRTARAMLHTTQADLRLDRDPFDGDKHERNAEPMALCQGEADIAENCNSAAP